ncbi:HAMP domain-containing sensor histidine kinase [Solibacillus sp. FSL H8-0523]|uniref:sensor histidine kinase n=1 Tax=Solibacillus sp. FSL H8-0523 TaxID=2954511 RepID=UPI0031015CD1
MKQSNWPALLKQSRHWIGLLCVNSGFFIFLAWVAYPETFGLLVMTMLIFTVFSILLGIVFTRKKQQKQTTAFYRFLNEPSVEQEAMFKQEIGDSYNIPVQDLAKQLRQLHDELQEAKSQSVDYESFIENWVHEIKTPLSLVHFVLQNRKDEMSPLVYQRLNHAKIKIHDHVERILFYAKLQATHVDYSLKKVSIVECFEDVLLELQSLLDEQEMEVKANIEDIPIVSDERALQFILSQLLVNAIKYRNVGSESLIWLETGIHREKDRYYIKVSDNGLGVLQSDLPFIFDKGFTGNTTNQKQATGMGLFLVKKLCEDLQIDIEVESEYERGFTIQLLFPKV